jgi:predicted ATPase/DNA-binding winged helix-turn-helix (wHTH) protein
MKQFGAFRLDAQNRCLWRKDVQIPLPPKPFLVLQYLVGHPGRLITHDELLDAIWPETFVQPQVLRTYMLELRAQLQDDAAQPRYIKTVPKHGYCFVAPVTEWEESAADTAGETPALVGRDAELACLHRELLLLEKGQRRMVFVCGEAGIGKTALVDAFCQPIQSSQQALVARGQCIEGLAAREDYYPLMEALRQLCSLPQGDVARETLAAVAPSWLARRAQAPEAARFSPTSRLPGDLCAALEELARRKPLILVFEDLQWADDATLSLLSALARRRAPARLMLLATCGPRAGLNDHPSKSLQHDLLRRQLCVEITLPPLSKAAVREWLHHKFEQEAFPQGLADRVHQHSEGNPLFAIAILEHLIAQRLLVREVHEGTMRWEQRAPLHALETQVPDRLAQMLEFEIERLRPEEQRILEAGSLMGIAFPLWAVAAALGEDVSLLEERCAELARRLSFVKHGGQDELPDGTPSDFYVFVHGLYREVLYQRQGPTRRGHRHVQIASRLAQLFAGREADVALELAMHFEAAGKWQLAANALCTAAMRAETRQAWAEARELLQRALRLAERLSERERAAALELIHDRLNKIRLPATLSSPRKRSLPAKA